MARTHLEYKYWELVNTWEFWSEQKLPLADLVLLRSRGTCSFLARLLLVSNGVKPCSGLKKRRNIYPCLDEELLIGSSTSHEMVRGVITLKLFKPACQHQQLGSLATCSNYREFWFCTVSWTPTLGWRNSLSWEPIHRKIHCKLNMDFIPFISPHLEQSYNSSIIVLKNVIYWLIK